MKQLRSVLDKVEPLFAKDGKLAKFYPLYEAADTFLFTPADVTPGPSHVKDGMDLKRMMITVVAALGPCILMGLYNTGLQANVAMANMGIGEAPGIRGWIMGFTGMGYDPNNVIACMVHGSLYFVPIFLACNIAGGLWEVLFATVRKHEVNEGFLVTGMLLPLTLPPTIPLWQVVVGVSFGVVIGKEIFGGTGKNFLNPALTARAFLYFAYPADISGDAVWTAVDGFSGATILGLAAAEGMQPVLEQVTFLQAFLGTIQGSIGETSTLACLLGAGILVATGIGSWRIMLSMLMSAVATVMLFNVIGSETNLMFAMPPHWHIVSGGFAFGLVFMATDPVSAAMTQKGKYFYGALIGFMSILIRVINPAFPEGVMLAILFGNVFAPLIDNFVIRATIKRRMARLG